MGHEIVALIPARRGSSRILNKNLHSVGGVNLINRAIKYAEDCGVERVYVFTDYESEEIECSRDLILKRSANTATRLASADSYINEFIENVGLKAEYILLLQPTSPFRDCETFLSIKSQVDEARDDVIYATFQESKEAVWKMSGDFVSPVDKGLPRVQQLRESIYFEDGNIYLFSSRGYVKSGGLSNLTWKAIKNSFPYTIDVNTEDDLVLARLISKEYKI